MLLSLLKRRRKQIIALTMNKMLNNIFIILFSHHTPIRETTSPRKTFQVPLGPTHIFDAYKKQLRGYHHGNGDSIPIMAIQLGALMAF